MYSEFPSKKKRPLLSREDLPGPQDSPTWENFHQPNRNTMETRWSTTHLELFNRLMVLFREDVEKCQKIKDLVQQHIFNEVSAEAEKAGQEIVALLVSNPAARQGLRTYYEDTLSFTPPRGL